MTSKKYPYWFFGVILLFGNFFMPIQSNSSEYLRLSSLIPQNSASSPRIIEFSDYQWIVRSSMNQLQGPGPNLFFDDNHSIWVDQNGYLHLTIRSTNNSWYASEISSILSFGHGTYEFTLSSGFESLDQNIVLGLFTYLDDLHEIDIEYARWGDPFNDIGQFVVQPYYNSGNIYRFNWSVLNTRSFHRFTWNSKSISFSTGIRNDTASTVYSNWVYTGNDIPLPGNEKVHLNLWLYQGKPPYNNEETEIIIESFQFTPISTKSIGTANFHLFFLSCIGISSVIITQMRKKNKKIKKLLAKDAQISATFF